MRFAAAALLAAALPLHAAVDLDALWDFARPEASEQRFRQALRDAKGDEALVLRTQIARTHSLRRQFDAAHRELDAIEPLLAGAGEAPRVHALLERGRTLRSAGRAADAAALNNIGVAYNGLGRHADALAVLREAQAAYERAGRPHNVWMARWMVAHTLRLSGRLDDALAAQRTLEAEAAAAGRGDPYVFDELALIHDARGDADRAAHFRALAARVR